MEAQQDLHEMSLDDLHKAQNEADRLHASADEGSEAKTMVKEKRDVYRQQITERKDPSQQLKVYERQIQKRIKQRATHEKWIKDAKEYVSEVQANIIDNEHNIGRLSEEIDDVTDQQTAAQADKIKEEPTAQMQDWARQTHALTPFIFLCYAKRTAASHGNSLPTSCGFYKPASSSV